MSNFTLQLNITLHFNNRTNALCFIAIVGRSALIELKMEVLKFRIWADTDNGTEMLYLDKGEFDNGIWFEAPIHVDKHHNAMQFIGCVDKNKKEVYEGDIVLFPNNKKLHIVDFYQCGFVLKSVNGQIVVYNIKPQYIEVVGNIYENADMLS